ncbi:MAG: hypothetical protein PHZ07_03250 [Patescibacteria group bacterium]|nr:hypothetical protein [Patescibacteria group bacterium]MDD4304364.1 hypothetical protein [Patescibacteria group bacterium]MDD4695387.1 hypothetical protein [Patescibacteria group bacterium]
MEKLSSLQKYILKISFNCKDRYINKNIFFKFYENKKNIPKDIENIIIKSLNRLIDRDLIIAYCKKTKEKIFIEKVILTNHGKKLAKQLLGIQEHLPIKYKK